MLKIFQASLQQYLNWQLPDVQAGFRKGRRTGDQIAKICWIIEKAREFQKNIYFCFIDYTKAFDCVDHNKLWKLLQEMGIPDHLTYLLRNLYAGQEPQLEPYMKQLTGSKLGKEYDKAVYCHCLFNLYTEHIMWNARLDELQARIKIAMRNIKNLRYADDTTLTAESEGELSSHHMQMWELDHKEGWVPKNWCFQIVVLKKTLEIILDGKEIKAVNPKGNQPCTIIGRTDAEAEAPILWPPDGRSWLTGK